MEGSDVHLIDIQVQIVFDELVGDSGEQLLACLFRKCHHHNLAGLHTLFYHQVSQAFDQGKGLTGSWTGNHQHRSLCRKDCFFLCIVYLSKIK